MTYESQEEHDHFEGAMEQSEKAYSEACCEKCGTGDPLVEFSCDKPDCPCHLKEILTKATLEANAEQKKIVDEYRKHKSWKDCNLECNIVKPIPTPEPENKLLKQKLLKKLDSLNNRLTDLEYRVRNNKNY